MKHGNVATSNKRAETEVAECIIVRRPEKVMPRAFFLLSFHQERERECVRDFVFGICWVIVRASVGDQLPR